MPKTLALAISLSVACAAMAPTAPALAQNANDINRLNQAMALCNSPAGKLLTECQQLKAVSAFGGIPGVQGVAGIGAANPAGAAIAQQIYATCIKSAGVNQGAIAQCNASLNNAMGLPQATPGPAGQYDRNTNTAMNIANNAAAYRDCISRLTGPQSGVNACTPLLNAAPGVGAPTGADPQAARLAAYQACNAQLSLQMRGHECATLLSGGPAPAGFTGGAMAQNFNPPPQTYNAPSQNYNPPAPMPGAPQNRPPSAPYDPLGF